MPTISIIKTNPQLVYIHCRLPGHVLLIATSSNLPWGSAVALESDDHRHRYFIFSRFATNHLVFRSCLAYTRRLSYKLAAPQEAIINTWPPRFFTITNVFCAKKGVGHACFLFMPQDGHWLASFEVIPPPKKLVFRDQKNKMKISRDAHPLWRKNLRPKYFSLLFRLFLSEILSRRCWLLRTTSDPAQNSGKFRPKLRFFCFSGENISTILSRRSRCSRTSRASSQFSRPRLIDCDAGPEQTVKILPVFGQFFFRTSSIFLFFQKVLPL